jgi:NTP pyrophosphatase (non-canonical NTP hydrolase)
MTPPAAGHYRTSEDVTPLRAAVLWFAEAMEVQLSANDHKPGWGQSTLKQLLYRLEQEAGELRRAIERGDAARVVIGEAADVANFALMIADNAARQEDEVRR